jgi:hypothetical protein
LRDHLPSVKERPDGLISLQVGARHWRALVEAKVANSNLDPDQIERYRALAKENGIDCVITISNQFATNPESHPLEEVRRSRSKVPVYHWSWMHILTVADLLLSRDSIGDTDQRVLMNELRRFLTHESAGVKGFDRMPSEWTNLNKLVSSGGSITSKSSEAITVLEAWHQETRDLSLILSRMTEAQVEERLPRKQKGNPGQRLKDELAELRDTHCLSCVLSIPDAAAPLEVRADITRRCVDVGMTLKAPIDKKTTKARANWLLRQLKTEEIDDLYIRLLWPGASPDTQFSVSDLRADPAICEEGKAHLAPHGFHIFLSKRLGARFTQQTNFIADLEEIVPKFYGDVGQKLSAWKPNAPRLKNDRTTAEDVATDALAEDSEEYRED